MEMNMNMSNVRIITLRLKEIENTEHHLVYSFYSKCAMIRGERIMVEDAPARNRTSSPWRESVE